MKCKIARLVVLVALAGCGSQLQFISNSLNPFPPRTAPIEIGVFFETPDSAHVVIGILDWNRYKPGLRPPTLADVLPDLKTMAASRGGDAIIIRRQEVPEGAQRTIQINADVIRFGDSGREP